jgi:hypothetical protein
VASLVVGTIDMITRLGALAVACAFAVSSGPARADTPLDTSRIVDRFDTDDIVAVATGLGFQAVLVPSEEGGKIVRIHVPGGVQFVAIPAACQPGQPVKCVGLELQMNAGKVPQVSFEQINQFNLDWVFTQAFLLDGEARLSRYEICDHGIALGNVAESMGQFAKIAVQYQEFLKHPGARASLASPPKT